MKNESSRDFLAGLGSLIDQRVSGLDSKDKEVQYLSRQPPNIIEFVTGVNYWNVPSTFNYQRQYQIMRDLFNLRCTLCNPQDRDSMDCWGKPRSYLESENLFAWSSDANDYVCPKCKGTMAEHREAGLIIPYNELICIAGMRSGKSYLAAHIGGYIEAILRAMSMKGRGALQAAMRVEKSEWLEVTFAASTAAQARETIYAKYREMRNNSPWINRHVAWVKEQEKKQIGSKDKWEYKNLDDTILDGWMQVRFNRVSSNSSGIAGKTRVFAAIDELARLSDSDSKNSAQELYRVLNQSLKTIRSAADNYKLNPYMGFMLNVTSPISLDDVGFQIYNRTKPDVPEDERLKRTFAWKGATWEFNPEQKFENFKEEFLKDPVGAQRDYGADPPAAETPLIEDPVRFWKSIDYTREPIASFSSTHITDKTGKKYMGVKLDHLKYNFIDQHYIFCDAGETFDSFSIVCAHPAILNADSFIDESTVDDNYFDTMPEGGDHISKIPGSADSPMALGLMDRIQAGGYYPNPANLGRLVTVIDFCVRIIPTKDRDIWFNSIIEVISEMQKKIKIAAVCFDSWQSTSAIQSIRDLGIMAHKVRLRSENFMEFRAHIYNDQVSLLPPDPADRITLSDSGNLAMGTTEEWMSGQGVGIVELLKLERSPDLKKIIAPKKGLIRGRGSDDVARCIIGANLLIKDSVVDNIGQSGRRRELRKKLMATATNQVPKIFNPSTGRR